MILGAGYTFAATETVTTAKLAALVNNGTGSNIATADISASAITDALINDVSGAKFTSLSSIPSGAGVIPAANLPTDNIKLTGDQSIDDVKTFQHSPIVPDPTTDNQATNKKYVDGTWADYSAVSSVSGWSSFTRKQIYVKKVGKTVFVSFDISGTSDATTAVFSLPYEVATGITFGGAAAVVDVGVWQPGGGALTFAGQTVAVYKDMIFTAFNNHGSKTILGSFWYEAA